MEKLKNIFAWYKILQILLLSIPVFNLLQNIFDIPLEGIPAGVIEYYNLLRDSIFGLISYMLYYASIILKEIPNFILDLVILYSIFFTAWMRTSVNTYKKDLEWFEQNPLQFEEFIKKAAIANNVDPEKKWLQVRLGMVSFKYRWLRNIWASIRWPIVATRNIRQAFSKDDGSNLIGKMLSLSFIFQLTSALLISFILLLFGYLQSI